MTDDQKYAMENLRCLGFGYKKIAAETGLSEGTVKSYFHRLKARGEVPVMRAMPEAPSEPTAPVKPGEALKTDNLPDMPSTLKKLASPEVDNQTCNPQSAHQVLDAKIKHGNKSGMQIMLKPCLYCGNPVAQNPGRKEKKFCSDSCKGLWWSRNKYTAPRKSRRTFVCQSCGEEFTAYGTDNRKYCSHACYISARFRGGAACV